MKICFAIPLILICALTGLQAQSGFQTRTVSIFKNGSAFYQKSGEIETTDGKYVWEKDIPRALFGTIWFRSPDNRLVSVRSYVDTLKSEGGIPTLQETLKAAEGKTARIELSATQSFIESVEGVIEKVQIDHFIMRTGQGWAAYKIADVKKVAFGEQPLLHSEVKTPRRIVELGFRDSQSKQAIDVMYLQKGLGWLPSYLLELKDEQNARLTLRATVVNDAEDIENADIHFVVGVPNFKFDNLESPLTSVLSLMASLSQLQAGSGAGYSPVQSQLSNVQTMALSYPYEERAAYVSEADENYVMESSSEEDLFFYTQKTASLKKGERAFFNVLQVDVPIEHVYKVELPSNDEQVSYAASFDETEEKRSKAVHTIRLKNEGATPWTTGTAMVVNEKEGRTRPISQDLLKFTPAKGESYLTITTAADIFVSEAEIEKGRQKEARVWSGYKYDLIQAAGQVKIKNYKDKAVKMNIRKTIAGTLKKSSVDWKSTGRIRPRNNINQINNVSWELTLEPGQERTIVYEYEVYVRGY